MSMPVSIISRRRGRPPAAAAPDADSPHRVEAVERALTILDAFDEGRPALSLAELSERTGLYPSTILRLAGSLSRFGYLHRGADGQFRIGPKPAHLGMLYRQSFELTDHIRPALARLVAETEETAAFYIRAGDKRICLYRHHSPRLVRHHLEEGAELTLERGASAHVLMAYSGGAGPRYEAIRKAGLCLSVRERDPETAALAAPVFGRGHAFLGALGITGWPAYFEGDSLARYKSVLAGEAARLSRAISGE